VAVGYNFGQIVYRDSAYYLYFVLDSSDGIGYWTFSEILGGEFFNHGWCSAQSILSCSGNWLNKETSARFTECGESVSSQPTSSPVVSGDDGNGDVDGDGVAEETTVLPGVSNNVFYLIISVVILCVLCVLLMCCFICYRNSRLRGTHEFDQKVGNHGNDW